MLSMSTLPTHESPETQSKSDPSELYHVAQDLMVRATTARESGDLDAWGRFLKAALDIMAEDKPPALLKGRQASPATEKVVELLTQDWQEVSQLSEATGLSAPSIHQIFLSLRQKKVNLRTKAIKRYRIVEAA